MSTTPRHTPGPWAAEYCGRDTLKVFKTSDKRRIATVTVKTREMDEANAKLLAASPGMLSALQAVDLWAATTHGWTRETCDMFRNVRAAINAATE